MIYFIYILNNSYSLRVSSATLTGGWWKECVCAMMREMMNKRRSKESQRVMDGGGGSEERLDSGKLVEIAYLLGP